MPDELTTEYLKKKEIHFSKEEIPRSSLTTEYRKKDREGKKVRQGKKVEEVM